VDQDSGQIETKSFRHVQIFSEPLEHPNVHERCNLATRHRWNIESQPLAQYCQCLGSIFIEKGFRGFIDFVRENLTGQLNALRRLNSDIWVSSGLEFERIRVMLGNSNQHWTQLRRLTYKALRHCDLCLTLLLNSQLHGSTDTSDHSPTDCGHSSINNRSLIEYKQRTLESNFLDRIR
jgi:hypothetical protein